MASGPRAATCPASSSSAPGAKGTSGGAANYGCGFLPTVHQGVPFRGQGDPVLYLSNPPGVDAGIQRASIDAIQAPSTASTSAPWATPRSPPGSMQLRARLPDAVLRARPDGPLAGESAETLAMYGAEPGKSSYANACLMALADG